MAQPQPALGAHHHNHGMTHSDHAVLVQSRETGEVMPEDEDMPRGQIKALPFAKSWNHLLAGG